MLRACNMMSSSCSKFKRERRKPDARTISMESAFETPDYTGGLIQTNFGAKRNTKLGRML